jgi:hypothetical protein
MGLFDDNTVPLTEREIERLEPPPRLDCPGCGARPWHPCDCR